jgi:hypothetical protein
MQQPSTGNPVTAANLLQWSTDVSCCRSQLRADPLADVLLARGSVRGSTHTGDLPLLLPGDLPILGIYPYCQRDLPIEMPSSADVWKSG